MVGAIMARHLTLAMACAVAITGTLHGQFRRGLMADSTEITLSPIVAPTALLPAGTVEIQVRNTSTAPARVVDKVRELFARQLTDNDSRVQLVDKGGDVVVVATLTEWAESRRNSTKYVSETRQIGTKQVTDKDGKVKNEPVYEYGRNKPSVVITAKASVRVEAKPASGGAAIADEVALHSIQEEHLTESGPPTRETIENTLIDSAVRKAAGRISPGREPVEVLLGRSDDVDKLNSLAESRQWQQWLAALSTVKPHRDAKRDAYRLHNIAVANEALAYEAATVEDQSSLLSLAVKNIDQALKQNAGEKYIVEAHARILASAKAYADLASLYQRAGTVAPRPPARPAPAAAAAPAPAAAMSNRDVIDLRAAGLDDDNLVAAIQEAKAVNFDLTPAGLKLLLNANISNRVITAMRAKGK
jgi:hypothetical protein